MVTPPPGPTRAAPTFDAVDPAARVSVIVRAADVIEYAPYSADKDRKVSAFLKSHGLDQLQLEALYRHRRAILVDTVETTQHGRKCAVQRQVNEVTKALHEIEAMRAMVEVETQQESKGIVRRLLTVYREQRDTVEVRQLRADPAPPFSRASSTPLCFSTRSLPSLPSPPLLQSSLEELSGFLAAVREFEARLNVLSSPRDARESGADGVAAVLPSEYNIVLFLRNYPELCAAAERLCAQPLPDVGGAATLSPTDLPRETAQIRLAMNAAPKIQSALRVKDEVIWQLTQACVFRRVAPAYTRSRSLSSRDLVLTAWSLHLHRTLFLLRPVLPCPRNAGILTQCARRRLAK